MEERQAAELASRLLALMPQFTRWAVAALEANRSECDPSFRQLAVLYLIQDGVTSPIGIAHHLGITRGVVTGLLDRLEQRGLVRREADPADRRRLRIVPTPAGIAASDRLRQAVTTDLAMQLAACTPEEIRVMGAAALPLERTVEALIAHSSPGCKPIENDDADPWDSEAGAANAPGQP